ncbi:hypothetical protein NFI96_001051, partial [Prochilodus magdalenae]
MGQICRTGRSFDMVSGREIKPPEPLMRKPEVTAARGNSLRGVRSKPREEAGSRGKPSSSGRSWLRTELTGEAGMVVRDELYLKHEGLEILQSHAQELKNLEKRTCEAETRITEVEAGGDRAHLRIQALEQQVRSMSEHPDELENRGRRKNIRIIGLPEGTEGGQPMIFFESWLPRFLEVETKGGRIKIERTHHTQIQRPGPKPRPQPIIIRFHNYADKQRVLDALRRSATKGQSLAHEGSKIMFFQDFPSAVLRKRKEFDEIKKRLRDAGA